MKDALPYLQKKITDKDGIEGPTPSEEQFGILSKIGSIHIL